MRTPTKTRDALSKVLPLRWSFGSKDRRKPAPAPESSAATSTPAPAELVEYLESGRRPRCTKDPIIALVSSPSGKEGPAGQQPPPPATSSSSGLSCVGRAEKPATPDFHRAPEGQRRQAPDKTGSLRRSGTNATKQQQQQQQREDGTLDRRSSRRSKQDQAKQSHDSQSRRGSSITGFHPSPSTHSSLNSSQQDSLGDTVEAAGDKSRRREESKTHDGLLSFLKGGFLKKDSMRRSRDSDWGRGSSDAGSRSLSKLSLSNGCPSGTTEGKSSSSAHSGRHNDELTNGKVVRDSRSCSALQDIKRSQSSSHIPSRSEQSLRRSASLHRNGLAAPSGPRSLAPDKASCSTLGRTQGRYSSTSLGRKRTVPESSF